MGTRGITNRVAHTGWQGRGVLGIFHGATDTVPKPSRISLLPMNSGRGQATVLSQVMSSNINVCLLIVILFVRDPAVAAVALLPWLERIQS